MVGNIALQVSRDNNLSLVEVDTPEPGPNEALVHVKATGICGSDIHMWKDWKVKDRVILGHESAAVVMEVGENVSHLGVGDRVAIEPGVPCMDGKCFQCINGSYNLCPKMVFKSSPPYDGQFRRFIVHDASWLYKLPPELTFEEGAMLEPLSVGLAGIQRTALTLGDSCVIAGAGPIGLVTLAAAKALGIGPVLIYDIDDKRLNLAKEIYSDVIPYRISTAKSPQETAKEIVSLLGEESGPSVTLECTGMESSITTCVYITRRGGEIMVLGMGKNLQTLPIMDMSMKQIDLKFIFRYHDTWPKAIKLLQSGKIDVSKIITHSYPLTSALDAFEKAIDRSVLVGKVMVTD